MATFIKYFSESQFVIIRSKLQKTEVDQVNRTSLKISTILYSTCFLFGILFKFILFFRFRVDHFQPRYPGLFTRILFLPNKCKMMICSLSYLGLWLLRGHCYLERSCHFQIWAGISLPDNIVYHTRIQPHGQLISS